MRLFWAEAAGVARRTGAEVHLLAFDEAVHTSDQLDPAAWRDRIPTKVRTGGGTDLTDLDAPIPAAPSFPVLRAVPCRVEVRPFGRLIHIGDAWVDG